MLISVVEKKPIGEIGEIREYADRLLNNIMLKLVMLQLNLTVWGIIVLAVSVAIFFIVLQINPNVWDLIDGEIAGLSILVFSYMLAFKKPLLHPENAHE